MPEISLQGGDRQILRLLMSHSDISDAAKQLGCSTDALKMKVREYVASGIIEGSQEGTKINWDRLNSN